MSEESTITLIVGRKHSGKTTLLKRIVKKLHRTKTILIVDAIGKFKKQADHIAKNAVEVGELLFDRDCEDEVIVLDSVNNANIRAAIIAAYYHGNITIIVDEADIVFGPSMTDDIREVVIRGRNSGIDIIMASLRPHRIHIDVRNQVDILFSFNIVNKTALKSIVDEFGADTEVYETITKLDKWDYLKYIIRDRSATVFSNKKRGRKPKPKEIKNNG